MSGPSKVIAAEFLRKLAADAGKPLGDAKQRAADLRLLANCIEGKVRWGKGAKHSWADRRLIGEAAYHIDQQREPGMTVKKALSLEVERLAAKFGLQTEVERKKLRRQIEAVRQLQRNDRRSRSAK